MGLGSFSAWRMLFVIGAVPSLLLLLVLRKVDESPAWLARHRVAGIRIARSWRSRMVEVLKYLPSLLALTMLMTAFMAFSHGTQDLYPTFLKHDHGIRGVALSAIAIVGNVGAVFGRDMVWQLLGAGGETASDYHGGGAVDPDDSAVGVEPYGGDAGGGRVPDAVYGAGSVGRDPGALERDVAAGGAGDFSGAGVPVGERAVVAQQRAAGSGGGEVFWREIRAGAGDYGGDCGRDCGGGDGAGQRGEGCGLVDVLRGVSRVRDVGWRLGCLHRWLIGEKTRKLVAARPYLIEQDWAAYTPEQHAIWTELVTRRMPQLREHACSAYLEGFEQIGLQEDQLPQLKKVSARLQPRTGWNSTAVSGFLPADAFFEMLAARKFPTTTWIRSRDAMEYTPEPDIFHDVFGHVPMHAHPVFADFLEQYGKVCAGLKSAEALERMGRLFWFTVEFGVIHEAGKIKVYGSGLISSHGECTHVVERGAGLEIREFDLDQVLDTVVDVSKMQPVLYAIESFEQIYEAAKEAESRVG